MERKINQSTPIVTQEDARTVAQGLIARSESPNNVNALKKALAASEKIVAVSIFGFSVQLFVSNEV